jgi:hypothetical protein
MVVTMKYIITIFLFITLFLNLLCAGGIKGSFSTGVFMGSPFWNADNYKDDNKIDHDDSFLRSVNHLRLKGGISENFTFRFNAARSDGFQGDNHLSNTKIYEVFGKYNFSKGYISAGRILPFNRWIRGSVDGGAFSYAISDQIKISAIGGINVRYGKLYDSDNTQTLMYADLALKFKKVSGKLKVYNDDDVTKTGVDFYGSLKKLRYNGNYGYDITNERIADGGMNLFYLISKKLNLLGNYRLFRTDDWKLSKIEFSGYLIERFLLGIRYKAFGNYYLDLRQMVSMTEYNKDYISFINLTGKYFHVGLNYLTGDSDLERIGISVGGQYSLFNGLKIYGGISPVDYMFNDQDDHQRSIAYYFRANYKVLKNLSVGANVNYYQDNEALNASTRGGILIKYNFGS